MNQERTLKTEISKCAFKCSSPTRRLQRSAFRKKYGLSS